MCGIFFNRGVYNQLPRTHRPVFMIVQSFDTLAAGNPNILTVICSLAQIPWVHLLATTDSAVNASVGELYYTLFDLVFNH